MSSGVEKFSKKCYVINRKAVISFISIKKKEEKDK